MTGTVTPPGATADVVPRSQSLPVPAKRGRAEHRRAGPHRAGLQWGTRGRGGVLLVVVDAGALALAAMLTRAPWWAVTGYVLSALLMLAGAGWHRPRITLRLGDELPGLLSRALAPALLLVPTAGARALLAVPATTVTVTAGRAMTYAVLRFARRRGRFAEPTLVLGTGRLGCEIAETLASHRELGLMPCGIVDSRPPAGPASLPWLGDLSALAHEIPANRIRRLIVCFPQASDESLVPVLRELRDFPVSVSVVPRLYELGQLGTAARDEVWGIPLVTLRRPGRLMALAKRTTDLVVAALLLVALAPALAVLAVLARVASGGPVLFRQVRMTGAGRTARIIKLRSLTPDPAGDAATDTCWSAPRQRCTRLGGLLRASHADELPQLVNVLRGEMSLVGPRPERPYFASLFAELIPGYDVRHRMPAGMTGWAQVHGLCGDTSVWQRARFDNRYVEDWSLWRDLVILVRTLARVVPRGTQAGSRSKEAK